MPVSHCSCRALEAILLPMRQSPCLRLLSAWRCSSAALSRRPRRTVRPRSVRMINGMAWVIDGDTISVGRQTGWTVSTLPRLAVRAWARRHMVRFRKEREIQIGRLCWRQARNGNGQEPKKYDRHVCSIICDGEDVVTWLVRNGLAIAAHGGQYRDCERNARQERTGVWGWMTAYHPGHWWHGRRVKLADTEFT